MFKPESLTPWVQLDRVGWFNYPFHTVETEYSELSASGSTGRSYKAAGAIRGPSLRVFTLQFPTMILGLDPLVDPTWNFLHLERFYKTHRQARAFYYDHPLFGVVRCRFAEPLQTPRGVPGGLGALEGFTLKLAEEPANLGDPQRYTPEGFTNGSRSSGYLDFQFSGPYRVFDFPNHTSSAAYLQESGVMPLGGGYMFTTMPAKREMRTFHLVFPLLRWVHTPGGKVDWQTDPTLNLGRLELFYDQVRINDPFWYDHPVYGRLLVRFDEPLKIPAGDPRNRGWRGPIELTLLEVPE